MNIMNKVTTKTLLKNKVRTIVTIIGIILSAAMFTAVTTFIASLQNYMQKVSVEVSGNWHAALYCVDENTAAELKKDSRVDKIVQNALLGYAKLDNCKNADKPYLYVTAANSDFFNSMPVHLTAGRLPKNSKEILLPEHLLQNGGVKHELSEKLSVSLGQRSLEGEQLEQHTPYMKQESFEAESTAEYTVVGFYKRPNFEENSAPGYTAITFWDNNVKAAATDEYISFKDPQDTFGFLEQQSQKESFRGGTDNGDVLTYLGVSKYNAFYSMLYGFAGILIGLIMFGAVSLIYNAFSISVSERTKQYGLLSSIGATKRQIRKSVLFEALVVSLIGVPIGILSGIGGIGVTLYCLRSAFQSFAFEASAITLSLHVNLPSILIASAVAIVTVLISAWIPSRRATKITAIQAIRQSNDIKAKRKEVKVSKLTYKLFGLEGMLAKKYFKRNKKKYRATVISLFMSIVLFVSASTFCHYMKKSVSGVYSEPEFDVMYQINPNTSDGTATRIFDSLKTAQNVTRASMLELGSGVGEFGSGVLSKDYLSYHSQKNNQTNVYFCAVDDEAYKAYLKENKLDEAVYMNSDKPLAIAKKTINYSDGALGKKISVDAFEKDQISFDLYAMDMVKYNSMTEDEKAEFENKPLQDAPYSVKKNIQVGFVAEKLVKGANGQDADGVVLMFPKSVFEKMGFSSTVNGRMCIFDSSNSQQTFDDMTNKLNAMSDPTTGLYDYVKNTQVIRNLLLVVNVFSYGFIILISLIAAANVFNTISTNISLRRREFAMLKTVGMTKRGFNRMMNMECLLYGLKSLLYGLPVAFLLSYLIFMTGSQGYISGFDFPWQSMLIATVSVFAVVFSTMIYSMSKIKKENPIDALKNENL